MLVEALVQRRGASALRSLTLCRNGIGERTTGALATALRAGSLPKLEELNLWRCMLGDDSGAVLAEALPQCKAALALRKLSLNHNWLDERTAAGLASALHAGVLPKLEHTFLGLDDDKNCFSKNDKELIMDGWNSARERHPEAVLRNVLRPLPSRAESLVGLAL